MVAKLAGALSVRTRRSSSRNLVRRQDPRGDVVTRLAIDLAADFAGALDHDDALQAGPIVSFL
jgi:hypothetical protein